MSLPEPTPLVLEDLYDVDGGVWLKGNLHTHSTVSDGQLEPQELVDAYRELGYDWLMISDHDSLADTSGLDPKGMVLIPGSEISARGVHMLHVDASSRVEPLHDRQKVIDAINADGGFTIVNHPNWQAEYAHCPLEELQALQGYVGVEIYNGVCDGAPGSAYAVTKWERLLSVGRRVWGFATDDAHRPHNIGLGWVVARASELSREAIVDALRHGRFYASTGIEITSITVDGSALRVEAPRAERIAVFADLTRRLAVTDGPVLEYDAAELMHSYIRVECWGAGGRCAWTQPFFIQGGMAGVLQPMLDARPVMEAPYVDTMPPMGLPLDEEPWLSAPDSPPFISLETIREAKVQTHVKALPDGESLLIAVRCDEPALSEIKAAIDEDGDAATWSDDCVQVFLDVEGKARWLWQLTVNSLGRLHSYRTDRDGECEGCETSARRLEDGWRVDISIPLASLGHPDPLASCRVNVGRNRYPEHQVSTWTWTGESFRTPVHYGFLRCPGLKKDGDE